MNGSAAPPPPPATPSPIRIAAPARPGLAPTPAARSGHSAVRRGRALLTALGLALLPAESLACDYPGPPPGSDEARTLTGDILWAGFSDATVRYDHGILGDAIEAGGLRARTANQSDCDLVYLLPDTKVFEDLAPRIADLDGDGRNEIVVVETDAAKGASLAIYGLRDGHLTRLAATPPIGRTHRWLAPFTPVDLDGDGLPEIAYVDRPHLAKILRIWRYRDGTLTQIASRDGLTNHRIGDAFIQGGPVTCKGRPALALADAQWRRVLTARLDGTRIRLTDHGAYSGRDSLARPEGCN